jgi:hypothetical protein
MEAHDFPDIRSSGFLGPSLGVNRLAYEWVEAVVSVCLSLPPLDIRDEGCAASDRHTLEDSFLLRLCINMREAQSPRAGRQTQNEIGRPC